MVKSWSSTLSRCSVFVLRDLVTSGGFFVKELQEEEEVGFKSSAGCHKRFWLSTGLKLLQQHANGANAGELPLWLLLLRRLNVSF